MKVLVTGNISPEVTEMIEQEHLVASNSEDRPMDRESLLQSVADKEGLLCMITDRIDRELLNRAPHLTMIANFGVGVNNIDIPAATEKGIPVSNTPGVLTDATADLAFTLMLSIARRVVEGDRMTREGKFQFWAPSYFLGSEVSGKTLGIIGMGRIGKAVAKRAVAFDVKILYHNRNRMTDTQEKALQATYVDLDTLLSDSDFVSLHVPLSDDTHHLIGLNELGRMKPTAFLINTSRGPVVDERALLAALRERKIKGAGLDVYENEPELTTGLKDLDNVILLPHVGSATIETRTKMGMLAAQNLLAGLRGEKPPNCLNWEAVSAMRQR